MVLFVGYAFRPQHVQFGVVVYLMPIKDQAIFVIFVIFVVYAFRPQYVQFGVVVHPCPSRTRLLAYRALTLCSIILAWGLVNKGDAQGGSPRT